MTEANFNQELYEEILEDNGIEYDKDIPSEIVQQYLVWYK